MAGPVLRCRLAPGLPSNATLRLKPAVKLMVLRSFLLPLLLLLGLAARVSLCLPAAGRITNRRLHNYAEHLDATAGPRHDAGASLLQQRSGASYHGSAEGGGRDEGEAEPTGDEYSDPQNRRAVSQAFAAELDPPGRVRAAASYRKAREQCAWEATSASDLAHEPCYRCV